MANEFDAGRGGLLGSNDLQAAIDANTAAVNALTSAFQSQNMGGEMTQAPSFSSAAPDAKFTSGSLNASAAGGGANGGLLDSFGGSGGGGRGASAISPSAVSQRAVGLTAGARRSTASPQVVARALAGLAADQVAVAWRWLRRLRWVGRRPLFQHRGSGELPGVEPALEPVALQRVRHANAEHLGGSAQTWQNQAFGRHNSIRNNAAGGNNQAAASEFNTIAAMTGGQVVGTGAFNATNALAFVNCATVKGRHRPRAGHACGDARPLAMRGYRVRPVRTATGR